MGLFGGKSQSHSIDDLLAMKDSEINGLIKGRKGVPFKSAKELRKATKEERRRMEGERGMAALLAGLQGGGTNNQNHKNIPVRDRVHPSRHREALNKEIHAAIRSGDRAAQVRLREEAKQHGYLR
jgi:hypothetical protein